MTNLPVSLETLDPRLSDQTAWIRRDDQRALRVDGPDRLAYLHSVTTADLKNAPVGTATLAAILNPKGRPLAVFGLHVAADAAYVQADAAQAPVISDLLNKYKMRRQIMVTDVSDAWHAVSLVGGHSTIPGALPTTRDADRARADALVPAGAPPPDGFFSADPELLERHRVIAGIPMYGRDVGENEIVMEVPYWSQSVSTTKGCYPGQEVVARLTARGGNIARRLSVIAVEAPTDAPLEGTTLRHAGEDVGRITSAARVGDKTYALALVRRSAFAPSTSLENGTVL